MTGVQTCALRSTAGAATSASALPWFVRQYIDATGATVSSQLKVYDVVIALIGPDLVRPMSTLSAGMGLFAYQGQNGGTMGTTALYSNSLAAGTGSVASNTGSIVTGLGGQVSVQPTLAVSTDGILTSFQNPVGSTTQAGRNLVIKGVRIHGMVTTVLANTVATGFAFSLAFGHTAVSLATAEAANAKAPRRIALGMDTYAINAAVGTTGNIIDVKLDTPVVVNPGEFIQVVAKNITQVTTSGVITWLITFDGYFE